MLMYYLLIVFYSHLMYHGLEDYSIAMFCCPLSMLMVQVWNALNIRIAVTAPVFLMISFQINLSYQLLHNK